jgi:hypothetical protein
VLLAPLASRARAAEFEPDLAQLVQETQQRSATAERVRLVWWLPLEYWRVSLSRGRSPRLAELEQIEAALRAYTVVAAFDGQIGAMGVVRWSSLEKLGGEIRLLDGAGASASPLARSAVDATALEVVDSLRPVFANILGELGENLHFYFFPGRDAQGAPRIRPLEEGQFTVQIGADAYVYRLPIGALLPPKTCPVDGERWSGAYRFCPRHGRPLE